MLLRPDGSSGSVLTITQFSHEWASFLEDNGWDMADGGRGRPSFPADEDAVNAMERFIDRLKENRHVGLYGKSVNGEMKYRERVVAGLKNEYEIEFDPEEIMFTTGGQFGLAAAFNLIEKITPGALIATPSPWYANHDIIASLYHKQGSKLHPVNILDEPGYRITRAALEKSLKSCSYLGAFLFCIPGNPLGNLMHKKDWLEIVPVLEKYDVPIILDEAFAEVVFDKNFEISLLHAAPHLKDRIILLRSGTKALGLSGERLAVQRVPKKYMPHLIEFQSRLVGNCPLIVQAGMSAAMENMSAEKKGAISEYYADNAEYICDEFEKLGIVAQKVRPGGGFYLLADLSKMIGQRMPVESARAYNSERKIIQNDVDIAMALMFGFGQPEKMGVAVVPACSFGVDTKKGWVRVSFSNHRKVLEKIVARLKTVAA